jgi:hypothetical protein
MRPGHRPAAVLAAAAADLGGTQVRTSASVIGHRGSESVIVATASWGYTVTVMLSHMRIALTIRPKGWLKKCLAVEGAPPELAREVADPPHLDRLKALSPLLVELTPMALRVEMRYGAADEVTAAIDVATSLARRARQVEETAGDRPFAASA